MDNIKIENPVRPEPGAQEMQLPVTQTFAAFWEGMQRGEYKAISPEEADRIVDEVYFREEPLTAIAPDEEAKLRKMVRNAILASHNRAELKWVAERQDLAWIKRDDYFIYEGEIPDMLREHNPEYGYLVARDDLQEPRDRGEDGDSPFIKLQKFIKQEAPNLKPLSTKEKVGLLSDPGVWNNVALLPGGVDGWAYLNGQSSNHLYLSSVDDPNTGNYGFTPDSFAELLAGIRKRSGRDKLEVLDVGGGIGTALDEAKSIDGNLAATNLTLHEEAAMYPADSTVLCPMERMPADFRNRFDLILSYASFKNCLYPEKAMENIVQALRKGGEARIQLVVYPVLLHEGSSTEALTDEDECRWRLRTMHNYLKSSKVAGLIDFTFESDMPGSQYGRISIQKLADS